MSIVFNNDKSINNIVKSILLNGKVVEQVKQDKTQNTIFTTTKDNTIYIKDFYNDSNKEEKEFAQFRVIQVINYNSDNSIENNTLFLFARNDKNKDWTYIGKINVDKEFNIQIVQYFIDQLASSQISTAPIVYLNENLLSKDFNNIIQFYEANYDKIVIDENQDLIDFKEYSINKSILTNTKGNYIKKINEQIYNYNKEIIPENKIKPMELTTIDNLIPNQIISQEYNSAKEDYSYFIYEDIAYLIYKYNNQYYLISQNATQLNVLAQNESADSLEPKWIIQNGSIVNLSGVDFTFTFQNDYIILKSSNYHLCLYDQTINNETWSFLYFPYLNNDKVEIFCVAILKELNNKINNDERVIRFNFIADGSNTFDLYKYNNGNSCLASRSYNSLFPYLQESEDNFENSYFLEKNYYSYPYFNSIYDQVLTYKDFEYSLDGVNWTSTEQKHSYLGLSEDIPAGVIPIDLEIKYYSDKKQNSGNNYENYYLIIDKNSDIIKKEENEDIDIYSNISFNNNGDIIIYSKNNITLKIINNVIKKYNNLTNTNEGLHYLLLRSKYDLSQDNFLFLSEGFSIHKIDKEEIDNIRFKIEDNNKVFRNELLKNINYYYIINLNNPAIITPFQNHYFINNKGKVEQFLSNNNYYQNYELNNDNYFYNLDKNKIKTSPVKEDKSLILKDTSCGFLSVCAYIKGILPNAEYFWKQFSKSLSVDTYNLIRINNILYNITDSNFVEVNNSNNSFPINIIQDNVIEITIKDKTTGAIPIRSFIIENGEYYEATYKTDKEEYVKVDNGLSSKIYCSINNLNDLSEDIANSMGLLSYPNTIESIESSIITAENVENIYLTKTNKFALNEEEPYIKRISIPNNDNIYFMPYGFSGQENYPDNKYNYLKIIEVNNDYLINIINNKTNILLNSYKEMTIWFGYHSLAYSDITNLKNIEDKKLICSAESFYGSKLKEINTLNIDIDNSEGQVELGEIFENLPYLELINGQEFLKEE